MRTGILRPGLAGVRTLIDAVDDAAIALLAARRRLVQVAARLKREGGLPALDPQREREVGRRALRLGRRLGLPSTSSQRVVAALIEDARTQQGLANKEGGASDGREQAWARDEAQEPPSRWQPWLRLVPPPRHWKGLLRRVPPAWLGHGLETALDQALAPAIADGRLLPLAGRRLCIAVSDLDVTWTWIIRDGHVRQAAADEAAEATVRGSAVDLLALASRREDADTLFFQRRLTLEGDVELGLTARNLFDQLPWEQVPLGLRILLHRGAGATLAARQAHAVGAR